MKAEILENLHHPQQLEQLYRGNKSGFKKAFNALYPEISHEPTAQAWHARLNYEKPENAPINRREIYVLIGLSVLAGLIAKLPDFLGLEPDYYYQRNIGFVVLPVLAAYFAWKRRLPVAKTLIIAAVMLLPAIYINLLPGNDRSDTLILACLHLPLFLWTVTGYAFSTGEQDRRVGFLRYNGDLVVMTTVMMIAGAILTGVTIGLFELINIHIVEWYMRNVAVWGLADAPLLATYLIQRNPQLVKNVSPVIAKIFTPLVLIMLVSYLGAMVYTGKDPYNDREFLLIFNVLLIGVMAIILFSVAERSEQHESRLNTVLLVALAIITILVNGIALSAIVFRISEWGLTPNRLAVLGANVLMLIHLLMVTYRLFWSLNTEDLADTVENSIADYLPVYSAWTAIVVFVFPLLFGFK